VRRLLLRISLLFFLLPLPASGETIPEVRLLVSNPAPFAGEEIVLTIELRHDGRLRRSPSILWPPLDDFIAGDVLQALPRREKREGGDILIESLRRSLRPLSVGRYSLEGGVSLGDLTISASPMLLRVRPLPKMGCPEIFDGVVGTAHLELDAAGEGTRQISVILTGNAPFDAFSPPRIEVAKGERVVFLDDRFTGKGDARRRVRRYLYFPGERNAGELKVTYAFYDPHIQRYVLLEKGIVPPRQSPGNILVLLPLVFLVLCFLLLKLKKKDVTLDVRLAFLLGRSARGLTSEKIRKGLLENGVDISTVQEMEALLKREDCSKFSPLLPSPEISPSEREKFSARLGKFIDKRDGIP